MITPTHYLLLSTLLFSIGITIVVARRDPLVVLVGIELMLQAVNLALAALTSWFQDWGGQVAFLVVMTIAAVELAVGLGAVLAYRQHRADSARGRQPTER
jgi:NADH-quinone oxidoreductase subunit K